MPPYVNTIIEYLNHHPMIGLVFTFSLLWWNLLLFLERLFLGWLL